MTGNHPLSGLRVLDLGRFIAAPFCAHILGYLGAEVIKVERLAGDDARWAGPFANGRSLYFATFNQGKKSIAVDLRSAAGQDVLRRLIKNSDVVVENFRPGTMAKMGLDFESISSFAPRVVLTSVSGFGQAGPYSQRAAFDAIAQAMSGLMQLTGNADDPPILAGTFIGDHCAGMYAALGTMAALMQRAVTDRGQHVDIALLDSLVSVLGPGVADYFTTGTQQPKTGNRDQISAPANCYRTRDGWVYVHAGTDPLFQRLCATMQRPDLLEDPRFRAQPERMAHYREIDAIVGQWTAERDALDIERIGEEAGFPCAAVSALPDLAANPQLAARGLWHEEKEPGIGKVVTPGPVPKLSDASLQPAGPSPELGQHTREILTGLLGYDEADCAEMFAAGAVTEPSATE